MRLVPPARYLYPAAALVFAWVPPRLARAIVVMIVATLIVLLSWTSVTDDLTIGFVVQMRPLTENTLLEINPILSSHHPVLISRDTEVMLWDLLVVAGTPQQLGTGEHLLVVSEVHILPVAMLIDTAHELMTSARFDQLHIAAVAVFCILISLYARLALRVAGSLIFGGLTAILISIGLALNAFAPTPFVPVPQGAENVIVLIGIVVGAVLAFKGMQDELWSLGHRIFAAIFAYSLAGYFASSVEIDDGLLQIGATVISILFPVLVPIGVALLVLHLHPGIEIAPEVLVLIAIGLILIRLVPFGSHSTDIKKTRRQSRVDPEIDGDGEFPIESLFRGGR